MSTRALIGPGFLIGVLLIAPSFAWAQATTPVAPQPPSPASTQTSTQPSPVKQLERDFLKNLLRDQKAIWTSPAHVRAGDLWWIGSISGATAAFIATDRETGDYIATYPDLLKPSQAVSQAGAGYTVAAAAASFYLIGRAVKNDRAMQTGLLAGEALINSAIVIGAVKSITLRARPDAGDERSEFFVGGRSFPSGHAGNVWSFATVVASEYSDKPVVQVVAYGAAGLISVARFTAQRHYLSDILIGSAIGFGVGRYVYRVHHIDGIKRGGSSGGSGVASSAKSGGTGKWPLVSPQFDRAAKGYSIGLTWVY